MSDDPIHSDRTAELRQRATLSQYAFTSGAPGIGRLLARLRGAWNSVATQWQVRPLMERQSDFNRTLVDWLERRSGLPELDTRLIEQDRDATRLISATGMVEARTANLHGDRIAAGAPSGPARRRLRIAYFSPLPPSRSGIADYSAELLPHLAELADVTVFADEPVSVALPGLAMKSPGEYPQLRQSFDLPLYQMGNSAAHETIYDLLVRYPGVVVLHDYFLHHFVRHHTAGRGDWTAYGREMAYSLGGDGRRLAKAVHAARADAPLFDEPLNRRLLDASLGLIVHSRFAAERAQSQRPGLPLAVVPALAALHPGESLRSGLELPDDALLFGSFGQITAEKRIDLALRAFRRVRENHPDAHFLLVGETRPDVDLAALIAANELEDAVHHIGYVADLDEFVNWIHTADVVVNLRQPTVGETSAVALRAMAAARPLIVFDHGWYSELPEEAALKTPAGDSEALRAAMERLAASADLRRSMGAAGLEYVRRNCLPQHVAGAYHDFLHNVLERAGNG